MSLTSQGGSANRRIQTTTNSPAAETRFSRYARPNLPAMFFLIVQCLPRLEVLAPPRSGVLRARFGYRPQLPGTDSGRDEEKQGGACPGTTGIVPEGKFQNRYRLRREKAAGSFDKRDLCVRFFQPWRECFSETR